MKEIQKSYEHALYKSRPMAEKLIDSFTSVMYYYFIIKVSKKSIIILFYLYEIIKFEVDKSSRMRRG